MKIVLIGPTYPYRGGISHYTTLLCRNFRRQNEVKFISFKRQYPKILFPGKTDKDPSSEPLKIDNVDYLIDSLNPVTWIKTAKEIVKYRPDKIIFNWWVAFWTPQMLTIINRVKRKINAEIVVICHNVVEHESSRLKATLTRLVLSKADRLITHSQAETDKCGKLLGENADVTTAFHPTYTDLSNGRYDKAQAKEKLGVSGDCLLFFGFVRPYKGLDVLLDAMNLCDNKSTTLMVVGEFWKDKQKYIEKISQYGISSRVKVVDRYISNEEIGLYFAAADIVVQPYVSASGSGVCQTAYGFDKPVIATNVGSLSEVVQDSVNGRLVEPNNAGTLAEAIDDSLEPENLDRLTAAAGKTKDKFGWAELINVILSKGPV
ncbi:MAG: glycosyltransferase [Anaerohalosphaeraceae bacterium]|nr:glycosyltransferase [Anaerohalosphaeraceae bacterium]